MDRNKYFVWTDEGMEEGFADMASAMRAVKDLKKQGTRAWVVKS